LTSILVGFFMESEVRRTTGGRKTILLPQDDDDFPATQQKDANVGQAVGKLAESDEQKGWPDLDRSHGAGAKPPQKPGRKEQAVDVLATMKSAA
jgi:hypothetical protein